MERDEAKRVIETLLYMTDHPLTCKEIQDVLDLKSMTEDVITGIIQEIKDMYQSMNSPLHVVGVAGGYQMATSPEVAPWIRKLYKERLTVKLSPSALETLAIIAYKQPISKSEIEQIRGVEASGVMDTLVERRLVKVVGRKDSIGRPLLYGTTLEFLRHFGLRHISELPDLDSLVLTPESLTQSSAVSDVVVPMETSNESAVNAESETVENATETESLVAVENEPVEKKEEILEPNA